MTTVAVLTKRRIKERSFQTVFADTAACTQDRAFGASVVVPFAKAYAVTAEITAAAAKIVIG